MQQLIICSSRTTFTPWLAVDTNALAIVSSCIINGSMKNNLKGETFEARRV
jgi:hypothetical protein